MIAAFVWFVLLVCALLALGSLAELWHAIRRRVGIDT